jgi:shikimate dehydrogenase
MAEQFSPDGTAVTVQDKSEAVKPESAAPEVGGRPGPDPTRYGDWEKNGRCIDF